MPELLTKVGVEPGLLIGRANAAAIEFSPSEEDPFRVFLEGLLNGLTGSDFVLVFPGRGTICTVHHHKQLWWVSINQQTVLSLGRHWIDYRVSYPCARRPVCADP